LGSCLSDLICDQLQAGFSIEKLDALYQWRTDQFLETVVRGTHRFIPEHGLEERLAPYLRPEKGADILRYQKKSTVDRWLDALGRARIVLLDNLTDLNVVLFSGVAGCAPETKVQIRHPYGDYRQLPFVPHLRPAAAETVRNNVEIVEFIKSRNPDISVWFVNYPFSQMVGESADPGEPMWWGGVRETARGMRAALPDLKFIPSLDLAPELVKDRWHFAEIVYTVAAMHVVGVELGRIDGASLSSEMTFDAFRARVLGRPA
jgi:lysophospholipase L1-like esterase